MVNEADVKRAIVKSMVQSGGYGRRVEDQYGVGIFDLILIPHGLPVFMAEVKMIRGTIFSPTPRQHVELGRIQRVASDKGHVIPLMIGWRNKTFYFSPPKNIIRYDECFSVTTSEMSFHDQLVQYYHSTRK